MQHLFTWMYGKAVLGGEVDSSLLEMAALGAVIQDAISTIDPGIKSGVAGSDWRASDAPGSPPSDRGAWEQGCYVHLRHIGRDRGPLPVHEE
jgi:hypothetical protein